MVAVTGIGHALPGAMSDPFVGDEPVAARRIVAVAVTPMELLRPGSDLAHVVDGAGPVDLLLACENEPVDDPSPVGILSCDRSGAVGPDDLDLVDLDRDDFDDDADDGADHADELRAAVHDLGLVDLRLHRLALPAPLTGAAESDLVAALSELVGFDPEPGVQILAPTAPSGDPQRSVVDRAVQRIVAVYGLPLQRYRCLELSVVDEPADDPCGTPDA